MEKGWKRGGEGGEEFLFVCKASRLAEHQVDLCQVFTAGTGNLLADRLLCWAPKGNALLGTKE